MGGTGSGSASGKGEEGIRRKVAQEQQKAKHSGEGKR